MNNDCHIVLAAPQQGTKDYYYKNTDADEMIFVHEGSGTVAYAVRGIAIWLWRLYCFRAEQFIRLNLTMKERLFIVESFTPFVFQKIYEQFRAVDGAFAILRKGYSSAAGSENQ